MIGHAFQSYLLQAHLNDSYQCYDQTPCRMENMDAVLAVEQLPLQRVTGLPFVLVCPLQRAKPVLN